MTESSPVTSEQPPQQRRRAPLVIGGGVLAAALVAGGVWFALTRGGDDLPTLVHAGPDELVVLDAEGAEVERIDSPLTPEQQTGQYPLGLQAGRHVVWVSDTDVVARDLTTGAVATYEGGEDDVAQPVRGSRTLVSVGSPSASPGAPFSVIDLESGEQISIPGGEDAYRAAYGIVADPGGEYVAAADFDARTTVVVPLDGSDPVEVPGVLVGVDDEGPVVSVPAGSAADPQVLTRLDPAGEERESIEITALERPIGTSEDGTVVVQEEGTLRLWRPGADALEDSGLAVDDQSSTVLGSVPGADRTVLASATGVHVLTGSLEPVGELTLDLAPQPSFLDARGGCVRVDAQQGESVVLDLESGEALVAEPTFVAFTTMAADPCTPVLQPEGQATSLTLAADDREVGVPPTTGIMAQLGDGSAVVARTEDGTRLLSLDGAFEPVSIPEVDGTSMYWVPTD